MPGVYRVDLLTRQVSAPDVDWTYAEPTEMLNPRSSENEAHELGESSGAYIIRIPFGPKDKYLAKEKKNLKGKKAKEKNILLSCLQNKPYLGSIN